MDKARICSVEGCNKKHYGHGYCNMHWQRWRKHGDPLIVINRWLKTDEERFWDNVDKREPGECWEWTAAKSSPFEYGVMRIRSKQGYAHRFSYELHYGSVANGAHVCHHCDNPKCVNPAHLFLSDHNGNMRDMRIKGRQSRRSLSEDNVREIRRLYATGKYKQKELANQFGLSGQASVSAITRRKTWRHIKEDGIKYNEQ